MKGVAGLMVLAVLVAMPVADADEAALTGYWYSEDYQPSARTTLQELSVRRADGTYEDEFRRYENCVLVYRQHEAGTWMLDGAHYRTVTTSINGGSAHFEDEYEVRSLTEKQFEYFHPKLAQTFTDTKVSAKFRFPDCPTS